MKVTPSSYAWVCDNTYHTDSPYRLFEQRKIPPPGASQYTKLGENSTLSEAEDRGCNVPWGFVCLSCKVHPIRIEDDRFVSDYSLNMIPPYDCNPPLQGFRFSGKSFCSEVHNEPSYKNGKKTNNDSLLALIILKERDLLYFSSPAYTPPEA